MYTVLVRPALSYPSETWPLSRLDERLLSIFERRIFRRRYNYELYKLFNEPDIIGYIEVKRLE
jgi:hypothetical protein